MHFFSMFKLIIAIKRKAMLLKHITLLNSLIGSNRFLVQLLAIFKYAITPFIRFLSSCNKML